MKRASRQAVEEARLTEELVRTVLGWRSAPGRFLKDGRAWMSKWRFAPFERLEDALQLLDIAADHYSLTNDRRGQGFTVEITIGPNTIKSSGKLKARTIAHALARALGVEV